LGILLDDFMKGNGRLCAFINGQNGRKIGLSFKFVQHLHLGIVGYDEGRGTVFQNIQEFIGFDCPINDREGPSSQQGPENRDDRLRIVFKISYDTITLFYSVLMEKGGQVAGVSMQLAIGVGIVPEIQGGLIGIVPRRSKQKVTQQISIHFYYLKSNNLLSKKTFGSQDKSIHNRCQFQISRDFAAHIFMIGKN